MIIIFVAECNPSYQISFICFFNASKLQHKETKKKTRNKNYKKWLNCNQKIEKKNIWKRRNKKIIIKTGDALHFDWGLSDWLLKLKIHQIIDGSMNQQISANTNGTLATPTSLWVMIFDNIQQMKWNIGYCVEAAKGSTSHKPTNVLAGVQQQNA